MFGYLPVAMTPDGTHLALQRDYDSPFVLTEVATGKEVRELPGQFSRFEDASAFSPDGALLAIATRHDRIRLWKPSAGRPGLWTSGQNLLSLARSASKG